MGAGGTEHGLACFEKHAIVASFGANIWVPGDLLQAQTRFPHRTSEGYKSSASDGLVAIRFTVRLGICFDNLQKC